MNAAVAAGHPATADAGLEILDDGGSAADAAIAATLASCVAETVMTGLLGGGHAIYFDAAAGRARLLDCFCAVPGLGWDTAAPWPALRELHVPFGVELVHYSIGPASCAVPGIPAGLHALWETHGRLPWTRLVEPALELARAGVAMPAAHVACLRMLEPVMTLDAGARIYAPAGKLLDAGDRLDQPGLVAALEAVRDEGVESCYRGTLAHALLELVEERGGVLTQEDLESYEAVWVEPLPVPFRTRSVLTRGGLANVAPALRCLRVLDGLDPPARTVALAEALSGRRSHGGHTTNVTVVDAEGDACVFTTSLGLGSGDFLPGFDLHLNSMLGETDLLHGPLEPGRRMGSMMAPTLAVDARGALELAAGAAGGARLRSALVQVLAGVLDETLTPQAAIDRPRLHPAGDVVHLEPGHPRDAIEALEQHGWTVRVWDAPHHFFGGVSSIGRSGAGADPRRSGAVRIRS